MENLTKKVIFLDLDIKTKLKALFLMPEIYQAENLNDLIINKDKIKPSCYKITKLFSNDPFSVYYNLDNGIIILNNFVFGELKQKTEYISAVNIREPDKKEEANLIVVNWDKLECDKTRLIDREFYQRTNVLRTDFLKWKPQEKEKLNYAVEESILKGFEFEREKLGGLNPPKFLEVSRKVQFDLSQTKIIQRVATFYSAKDKETYLLSYELNSQRKVTEEEKEEVGIQELKPIYGFS